MPIHLIPDGQRIWQAIASAYRPDKRPFALYAPDEKIGELHVGTLAINFEPDINMLTMHNPWMVGNWLEAYPLRLPDLEQMVLFPKLVTPAEAATGIGYVIADPEDFSPDHIAPMPEIPQGVGFGGNVPAWVQAYRNWLLNQIEYYGSIVKRETRRDF